MNSSNIRKLSHQEMRSITGGGLGGTPLGLRDPRLLKPVAKATDGLSAIPSR